MTKRFLHLCRILAPTQKQEIEASEELITRLQRALAFWLPQVPPNDSPAAKRCGDDSFLLGGYEGPEETCAEELGWITMHGGEAPSCNHGSTVGMTLNHVTEDAAVWHCLQCGEYVSFAKVTSLGAT